MEGMYLAHRSEDGREETVLQHLEETAEMAEQFAAAFDAGEQGRLAGLAHDLGKYSEAFQRRIRGSSERVDHSTAGAVECFNMRELAAALAVAGHHGGLPDVGSRSDTADKSTLMGRIKRWKKGGVELCGHWKEKLKLPQASYPAFLTERGADSADILFFTRMLYSCLVDADFLCTERFMSDHGRSDTHIGMDKLERRLREKTAKWFPPDPENRLNVQRCAILRRCQEEGERQKPGLFTLTVPTGGGKTVASLAFALAHARANGLERVIYVIPYTSIIDQNAQVFREKLGEEAVLEHHSGVLYEVNDEATPETIRLAQATENWDMPVVATTAVQFFESLFADRSSKCRKLHNLAKSVIIFDEAQMLPVPQLRPCVFAISQLVAHYGATAVLCTATQPALDGLFREFLPGTEAVELCPQSVYDPEVFKRVTFRQVGKLSLDELTAELNSQNQVLCIVNSRKAAREVFGRLEGEGCFHLSTLMYPTHRRAQIEEIKKRLNDKKKPPCRVVSTSLIEAGVDVDFPAVFREVAGLDSVLQAAGRCNREGKNPREESVVTVFRGEWKKLALIGMNIDICEDIMKEFNDLSDPVAITGYFNKLMKYVETDRLDKKETDKKSIMDLMREGGYRFRDISEKFRMIEDNAQTIYIPLGEGEDLVKKLKAGERSRDLFRKLGNYGVSVYHQQFEKLEMAGALETLEDGSVILTNTECYKLDTGLSMDVESGNALWA